MTMYIQIVINACYGGFGLSRRACEWLVKERGRTEFEKELVDPDYGSFCSKIDRADSDLVACVKALGSKEASGQCARLVIEDLYFDPMDEVSSHDGYERIF